MAIASFDKKTESRRQADMIGPGVVVLVVGPSGAGKDALLQGVAQQLSGDPTFHFPRRFINRPQHAAERNDVLTIDDTKAVEQSDAYALSWQAHGLVYAISSDIDGLVKGGACVVFNASRTIIPAARSRYAHVKSVYIEASRNVRANRLQLRGRETTEEIEARLKREVHMFPASAADEVICNDGTLDAGVAKLLRILHTFRQSIAQGR